MYMLVSCCDNTDGTLAWSWAKDKLREEIDRKKLRAEAMAAARAELRAEQQAAAADMADL